MNTATIIDVIISSEVTKASINHIIKQHHISQRMRRKLKHEGLITINGEVATWDTLVQGGDHVVIALSPEQEFDLTPMDLDIIYEDNYVLAINKAPGILMHPTSTVRTHTLANGVLHYYKDTNQAYDFHPIHRLDKDTSGIVIIAKTAVVQHAFEKQTHPITKLYNAIVDGYLTQQYMSIHLPIGRKEGSIIERCCTQLGKSAHTDVTVLEYKEKRNLTHIQCLLHTGRTHQIRVHLSHLGFPLTGDDIYGGSLQWIDRQALHAGYLAFTHPMTKEYIQLRAPMPKDMQQLLE
ncbi:RluA family pseudouridine synthase [Veillonella agrestimuris]|uniref:RluA family pseudouridine synthase n=1 Tax=Veillonella agrestimuris TaxID=2941340 RepID=UPI00203CE81A|nr:RluA family pseudouridine synthase [Veillonella agrestimuris]